MPPVLLGGLHLKVIAYESRETRVRPVGASGKSAVMIATDACDKVLGPAMFTDLTLNRYSKPD